MTQMTQEQKMDLGNTIPNPGTKRSRKWCFTLNNYTDDEYDTMTQVLSSEKFIVGKEIGEQGTPHLQGYVEFANARSFASIKKLIGDRAHIEVARGTTKQNVTYCSKDGVTISTFPETSEDQYEKEMKDTFSGVTWKPWQVEILTLIESQADSRTVNWFYEEEGNLGKSFLCKYIDWKYNAIIANGKQADVFNQYKSFIETYDQQPKVALIDIPRSHKDFICYSTLEKIKDGLIYSGKYEGGKLRLCKHHLIVFANFEPDRKKLSEDRWNVIHITN